MSLSNLAILITVVCSLPSRVDGFSLTGPSQKLKGKKKKRGRIYCLQILDLPKVGGGATVLNVGMGTPIKK